jgi:c-di-GMP-binding flagellar brake protein YcgR
VNENLELLLPEVQESPNGRRRHFRLAPAKMIGVFGLDREEMDLSKPDRIIDFSLGGAAVVTEKAIRLNDRGFLSIFYEDKQVHKLEVVVVSCRKAGQFRRLGLEFVANSSAYRLQKPALEAIELACIEKGEF